VLGNPFGAPADHPGEGNLRLIYPTTWARRVDELAFSEGWANFYSVAAQSLDGSIPSAMWGNQVVSTNGRGSESGDLLFERKNVENAPAPLANGARNDANFGEDDEMTVTRVLWDLFDPVGGAAEPQDRIELGLQGVFNLLVRPVPAQMTPVFTLSDLSNKLLAQRPNPANKVDIGAIFELNNVSPTGLGVQIGGANVQAIGQLDGRIPTFVWTVPQGERRNFSTHELLDVFNVSVFNANYTVELLTSGPGRTH